MLNILIPIAIIFLLIIIFQIGKIFEFLGIIKDEKDAHRSHYSINGFLLLMFMIIGLVAAFWYTFSFDRYLPPSASIHGDWIDEMFMVTLLFTGIVFIFTEVLLFYFAYKYHHKEGRKGLFYPDNHKLKYTQK